MKYTFTTDKGIEKTVEISDDYIRVNKCNLGLTTNEAIHLWLYDNGYESNEEAEKLTAQANTMRVSNSTKKRKAPSRKPDYIKRTLIAEVKAALIDLSVINVENNSVINVENVAVTNLERTISFSIGEDIYEITLSKKRKTKK